MQSRKSERLAELTRLESLTNGSLIDVSDAACASGINVPVALSRGMWTSLVRPFPSAQAGDYFPLEKLLDQLRSVVQMEWLCSKKFRYFLPVDRPAWIGSQFLVRVQFNYARNQLATVVVSSTDEMFVYKSPASPAVLPSSLMVRLFRTLQQLSLCGRGADTVLLERMLDAANLLVQTCPLLIEMSDYFRRWQPQRPTGFSREEFRTLLLRTMAELLICLGACESVANARSVNELVKYHLALASPLSDLAMITESMLRLAARLPHREGPLVGDPFPPLLEACFEMRCSLDYGSTTIPAVALTALREQVCVMDSRVFGAEKKEYLRLREWFNLIDDGSPLGRYVNLGRWHSAEPVLQ